jgi:hypothetical protein
MAVSRLPLAAAWRWDVGLAANRPEERGGLQEQLRLLTALPVTNFALHHNKIGDQHQPAVARETPPACRKRYLPRIRVQGTISQQFLGETRSGRQSNIIIVILFWAYFFNFGQEMRVNKTREARQGGDIST